MSRASPTATFGSTSMSALNAGNSNDEGDEFFLEYADPDLLNPPLPEPYRSIDIIVRSIIDDAMTLIVKKDEAERASKGWQTAKPCYPTSLVSGLGVVTSYASTTDGRYAFAGNSTGDIHVLDLEEGSLICSVHDPDFTAAEKAEPIHSISVVTSSTGKANASAPRWITVACASVRRVKVFRCVSTFWKFTPLHKFDIAGTNFEVTVPASVAQSPASVSNALPLSALGSSPLFSNHTTINVPLSVSGVTLAPDATHIAICMLDGTVDVFPIALPPSPQPVAPTSEKSKTDKSGRPSSGHPDSHVQLPTAEVSKATQEEFGTFVSNAVAAALANPEAHIVAPIAPRFPLPLIAAIQAQQAAAASAAAAPAADAASDKPSLSAYAASLSSLSLSDLTSALLPSWSAAVLPQLPNSLTTPYGGECGAPLKVSPATLAAEREILKPEVEARVALLPKPEEGAPETNVKIDNTKLQPLLPQASLLALKKLTEKSSSVSPALQLQQLLPVPTVHFVLSPLPRATLRAPVVLGTVGVLVWWRSAPLVQRFRLPLINPTLPQSVGAAVVPPAASSSKATPEAEYVTSDMISASACDENGALCAIGLRSGAVLLIDNTLNCARGMLEAHTCAVSAIYIHRSNFMVTAALDACMHIFSLLPREFHANLLARASGAGLSSSAATENPAAHSPLVVSAPLLCSRPRLLPAPIVALRSLGQLPVVSCQLSGFDVLFLIDLESGELIGKMQCGADTLSAATAASATSLVAAAAVPSVPRPSPASQRPLMVSGSMSGLSAIGWHYNDDRIADRLKLIAQSNVIAEEDEALMDDEGDAVHVSPQQQQSLAARMLMFPVHDVLCTLYPQIAYACQQGFRAQSDAALMFTQVPQRDRDNPSAFSQFGSPVFANNVFAKSDGKHSSRRSGHDSARVSINGSSARSSARSQTSSKSGSGTNVASSTTKPSALKQTSTVTAPTPTVTSPKSQTSARSHSAASTTRVGTASSMRAGTAKGYTIGPDGVRVLAVTEANLDPMAAQAAAAAHTLYFDNVDALNVQLKHRELDRFNREQRRVKRLDEIGAALEAAMQR